MRPQLAFGSLLATLVVWCASAAAGAGEFAYTETGYVLLDPLAARTPSDERVALALGEGLTTWDPTTGKAVPGVAASFEAAADGRSWTFRLRPDAVWSDGKPVMAKDFVFAWRRALDPLNGAARPDLLRPLRGVASLQDADAALAALDVVSKGLRELIEANAGGVPGDRIESLITESGARVHLERIDHKEVRRMLKWGEGAFPPEKASEAREAIRGERKKHKDALETGLESFGVTTGVVAKDDRTLVVETEGWRPELPELLARAVFLPLRQDLLESKRDAAFEPADFVGNGPFLLKGRGAKPRAGKESSDSVVHLVRNARYQGPAPAATEEVFCWTDLGPAEDRRRYLGKQVQWMANPTKEARKELEKAAGFRTRPAGTTLFLLVRADRPPFDRLEARKAFAAVVDRGALAKLLWPGGDPAERLVPPGVRNLPPGVAVPPGGAAAAKDALKAVGLKPDDWPWIEVFHQDEDGAAAVATELTEAWKKVLGIESSGHVNTGTEQAALRGGKYAFVLEEGAGSWNDPSAWLLPLGERLRGGSLGWKDEAFDAMIAGVTDPAAAAASAEKILAVAKDAATLKARLEGAKAGGEAARESLRLALLSEAEHRLLSQYIAIPIAFPRRAELMQDVTGLGTEEAWRNPSFPGSLRSARR